MKFLATLFIFISLTSVAQDKELFDYVNTYRVVSGVGELEWCEVLYKISSANTLEMVTNDSLMHSRTNTYECSFKGNVLNPTSDDLAGFKVFIKKYFGVIYVEPTGDDVGNYLLMNVIYSWHKSPPHKELLLDDVYIGSISVYIGETTYRVNYRMIGDKRIEFSSFISHWGGSYYSTFNSAR
jgi:hypothetical protein